VRLRFGAAFLAGLRFGAAFLARLFGAAFLAAGLRFAAFFFCHSAAMRVTRWSCVSALRLGFFLGEMSPYSPRLIACA
jgi:hypothetical protein